MCSCGGTHTPAFRIVRSKVALVDETPRGNGDDSDEGGGVGGGGVQIVLPPKASKKTKKVSSRKKEKAAAAAAAAATAAAADGAGNRGDEGSDSLGDGPPPRNAFFKDRKSRSMSSSVVERRTSKITSE